jgi:hypothetical protein
MRKSRSFMIIGGFEPPTYSLSTKCSTAELYNRYVNKIITQTSIFINAQCVYYTIKYEIKEVC